jgi:DNA-binding TFAR19-related protein (PDSD5 family)
LEEGNVSGDESDDLEAIKARKMLEMQRRLAAAQRQPNKDQGKVKDTGVDDLAFVRSLLMERGEDVLDAALSQYPKQAQEVVHQIAILYRSGKLKDKIPGEELIALFHDLGMRVHLETTISYIKDGKRVPLSDKFKEKSPEDSD